MKKIAMISVTVLSVSALSAQAAVPGTYIGGGLGVSRQDTPNQYLSNSHKIPGGKDSRELGGVGARAFAGYNFNQYFGIEAGLAHYANSTYESSLNGNGVLSKKSSLDYQMNAVDLVGKGYLPVGQGFNLYGLAGIARVGSDKKLKGNLPVSAAYAVALDKAKSSTHKIRPVYGVGASYDIPESNFTTNVEFSRIQGSGNVKTSPSAIPSANLVTLNLSYNFG